jgi:hypothetical protein
VSPTDSLEVNLGARFVLVFISVAAICLQVVRMCAACAEFELTGTIPTGLLPIILSYCFLNILCMQQSRPTDASSSSSEKPPHASTGSSRESAGEQPREDSDQKPEFKEKNTSNETPRSFKDIAQETVKLSTEVAAEMAKRLGFAGTSSQAKSAGTFHCNSYRSNGFGAVLLSYPTCTDRSLWIVQVRMMPPAGLKQHERWDPGLLPQVGKQLARTIVAVALVKAGVGRMRQVPAAGIRA